METRQEGYGKSGILFLPVKKVSPQKPMNRWIDSEGMRGVGSITRVSAGYLSLREAFKLVLKHAEKENLCRQENG